MEPLVIFGAGQIAEIAHFYFSRDSDYKVAGFTVDGTHLKEPTFCGLPVVAFEEAVQSFSPGQYRIFVAMSYARVNRVRAEKLAAAEQLGYRAASYVSSKATVWERLAVGPNCFILEDNTVQPFSRIGRNVTMWSGNHIGHHSVIGDHVFIASHAVISGAVTIGDYSFIGVNATIRDNVSIGKACVIGAGSLVLSDTQDEAVLMGTATEPSRVPSSRLRNL